MSEHDQRPDGERPGAPPLGHAVETGDERVDRALARLAELDDLSVHEHAAVVESIHRSLQDTLAEDEG